VKKNRDEEKIDHREARVASCQAQNDYQVNKKTFNLNIEKEKKNFTIDSVTDLS